ncbi:MAG: 1-pyrroline-5-carboxylate dehydrogenase [Thermoprotei archaeon]|nr:MAG: 1-pyrroline-5-carboxylate dehydrogenase [Thermoprotei archaeon]
MSTGIFQIPKPRNEPILTYAPGTREREELMKKLKELKSRKVEIPLIIGGKKVKSGELSVCRCPHNHSLILGYYHEALEGHVEKAIDEALKAWDKWANMDWYHRAMIFLKAAELLAGPYRFEVNAAIMLCQSKTPREAEIDLVELVDFWRFNAYYMRFLYEQQPESLTGELNRIDWRPLEGFVFAITPFNFFSIGGNLPTAPALMGNVVVWKPSTPVVYSNYYIMKILEEAGLPPGVINFIPGNAERIAKIVFSNPNLAGVHFTGSTETFKKIWKTIGENIWTYKSFPRIVGETGGKDFIFLHKSADIDEAVVAIIRGAFEYQGQKCSAASRLYVPKSLWPKLKEKLFKELGKVKVGEVEDFTNFMGALITREAFNKVVSYIEHAKAHPEEYEIVYGGKYDDSKGYFVWPTIVVSKKPKGKLMEEEIFGPVLTVYVYDDDKYEETLRLCNETSPYGLTGSIFAKDREAIMVAERILRWAAGNFYINDKPTGAIVNRQPFGGSRASGTNDKAGWWLNLLKWVTLRAIKENLNPPKKWEWPYMGT